MKLTPYLQEIFPLDFVQVVSDIPPQSNIKELCREAWDRCSRVLLFEPEALSQLSLESSPEAKLTNTPSQALPHTHEAGVFLWQTKQIPNIPTIFTTPEAWIKSFRHAVDESVRRILNEIAATAPFSFQYPATHWDDIEKLLNNHTNEVLLKDPHDLCYSWDLLRGTCRNLDSWGHGKTMVHTMAQNMQRSLGNHIFEVSLAQWGGVAFPPGLPHARKLQEGVPTERSHEQIPYSLFMDEFLETENILYDGTLTNPSH